MYETNNFGSNCSNMNNLTTIYNLYYYGRHIILENKIKLKVNRILFMN